MRILLDSDVTLDYILEREPFFEQAKEIFERYVNGEFVILVSAVSLTNIFYIVRKQKGKDAAFLAIKNLLISIEICNVNKLILQNALSLNFTDYEDAVQHTCAVENNLDAIVTRNLDDYKNATMPVYAPAEYLKLFKQK